MKRVFPLFAVVALLPAAALADGYADGSFSDNFGSMSISPSQSAALSGGGLSSGGSAPGSPTGSTGDTPRYVDPATLSHVERPSPQQPNKPDQKKDQNGDQTPQMPQLPSPSGGDKSGGNQQQGGGGGGCKSSGQNQEKAKDQVAQDFSNTNAKDKAVAPNYGSAASVVQNADKQAAALKKAQAGFQKAKSSLDSATQKVSQQNNQNKQDIEKLDTAQANRQSAISGAKPGDIKSTPPQCPASSVQSQYGDGDSSQGQEAGQDVTKAKQALGDAKTAARGVATVPGAISGTVNQFTAAAAVAAVGLGGPASLAPAQATVHLTTLSKAAQAYQKSVEDAARLGDQAVEGAHQAQDASVKAAEAIKTANEKAKLADEKIDTLCSKISGTDASLWDAAEALDEPGRTSMKTEAVNDATQAIADMNAEQTKMATEIQQVKTKEQDAETKLDQAKQKIKTFWDKASS